MNVNFSIKADKRVCQPKTQAEAVTEPKTSAALPTQAGGKADQVVISQQGRQASQPDPFSKMETAVQNGDIAALVEAAKERNATLEVNWNAMVDPGGEIYGVAYVQSLLDQFQKASSTIEAYYADAHEENLTFDNPYTHILHKYKFEDSPYYRSDMTTQEREMAFRQERALLWGGHVLLKDPYALASSGGLLDVRDTDRIARQAAQDKLDELIKERMQASQD